MGLVMVGWRNRVLLGLVLLSVMVSAGADELRIAAASNFASAFNAIVDRFETVSGQRVVVSYGSTGKHYAQIRNGAPFDLFFAADRRRPELLEEEGIALPGSRFTYAIGRLALWSPTPGYVDDAGVVLTTGNFRHLAIANPKLAPYGAAARELLERRGVWQSLQGRMVRGENIAQAFNYVQSGNAELGLVAYAQVVRPGEPATGSLWLVPRSLHAPIEQQAVALNKRPVTGRFLAFIRGAEALEIIRRYGYDTP